MSRKVKGCAWHGGAIHGGEAEELRAEIEELIKHGLHVSSSDLQRLLDRIDARDSLAHLEAAETTHRDGRRARRAKEANRSHS